MALRDAVAAAAPRPVLLIAAGNVATEGHAGRYIASASVQLLPIGIFFAGTALGAGTRISRMPSL